MQVVKTEDTQLPAGFGDFSYLLDWALETENERHARRLASTIAETRILYDAVHPRLEAIIVHLKGFPIEQPLPPADRQLYLLALACIEVAQPIELKWKHTLNEGSYPSVRLNRPHRP